MAGEDLGRKDVANVGLTFDDHGARIGQRSERC